MSTNKDITNHSAGPSQLALLEDFVRCEAWWELTEQLEQRLRQGPPRNFTVMDILVTEIATQLVGSANAATRMLADPPTWAALKLAAQRGFPNHPARRLSQTAPSRHQHQRARQKIFTDKVLAVLQRGARQQAVRATKEIGLFDPTRGSWTHPDSTQGVAADTTRIRTVDSSGHQLWVLTGGTGASHVVLDAEVAKGDDRMYRSDADRAVAMLRDLLDEHGDSLRDGLRCFTHDTALDSKGIDDVMGMRVLPIVKEHKLKGGKPWSGSLGVHHFTAPDGTTGDLEVDAVNGAPVVTLPDSSGVDTAVPLHRRLTRWEDEHPRNRIAYSQYAIPDSADVPAHLKGSTTEIRLTSTSKEASGSPNTRRTSLLRPFPEGDVDFDRLIAIREQAKAVFADLKSGRGRLSGPHARLQLVAYQMLSITKAVARHRTTPRAE